MLDADSSMILQDISFYGKKVTPTDVCTSNSAKRKWKDAPDLLFITSINFYLIVDYAQQDLDVYNQLV